MKRSGFLKRVEFKRIHCDAAKNHELSRAKLAARFAGRSGLKATASLKRKRLRAKPDPEMQAWSKAVLARDGYRCQWPGGCATGDARIDAHHIAERSLRPDLKLDLRNGIALCREHHNWLPLHRAEAIAMGLLSDETYEKAQKEKAAA